MPNYDDLPTELSPYTGSFFLDSTCKQDILSCLPKNTDDINEIRYKLQKLVTYVYIKFHDEYRDPPHV